MVKSHCMQVKKMMEG